MKYNEVNGRLLRAYHGTPHEFSAFEPEFGAVGHAQEGAGIYFTTSLDDAKGYATTNGYLHVVDLNINKELKLVGRVNAEHVSMLMQQAPDLSDTLTNWDEHPVRAFNEALRSMLSGEGPKACFESVWFDFYRDSAELYLRNVAALGYGGTIIPKANNTKHIVMYDVSKITIRETIRVG